MILKQFSVQGKENRLKNVGNVAASREYFYQQKPNNLFSKSATMGTVFQKKIKKSYI